MSHNIFKSRPSPVLLLTSLILLFPGSMLRAQDWERQKPVDDLLQHAQREARNPLQQKGTSERESEVIPNISPDFVSYLYIQSENIVFHIRWHAITHVSSLFVVFDADGNFTNRTSRWDNRSSYLKAGGAAEASGTKVIMTVNSFDDDPDGVIERVMTIPSLRTNLINNIVDALENDTGGYNGGVNFDLEFAWGTNIRDGIVLMLAELRQAMDDAGLEDKEISIYCNPTLSTNQWDVAGMAPHIDYLLYSGYPFASSTFVNAVGDHEAMTGRDVHFPGYLENGLPPEKLVLTLPTYGRRYENTTNYGSSGSFTGSMGFTDGLYETTIGSNFGGPHQDNYRRGDETSWYEYLTDNGQTPNIATWEGLEGINYKIRHPYGIQDATGGLNFDGVRFGGLGFWSGLWMSEFSSYDSRTNSSTSRTRTYPHIYQTIQEALAPPGETEFFIDRWEGYDFRWRDPWRALDTSGDTNNDSFWDLVRAPGGIGAPESTYNAAGVTFDFESNGSTGIFAHEVLNSPINPSATDYHATVANFDSTTAIASHIYLDKAYPGSQLRMLVIDADLEIETGPAMDLDFTGWQRLEFDLAQSAGISGFSTNENNLNPGDGVIDTAEDGVRDVSFYGFVLENANTGIYEIIFDELTYQESFAEGKKYVINEFRYDGSNDEFVEIFGPAGAFPQGFELRVMDGSDGSFTSIPVTGSIVDDGTGNGLFVIGDSDVPNVDSTTGFSSDESDILDADPSAIQLVDANSGTVHDSVVYEAYGGVDDLVRMQTLGVADEGYPWLGRIATGEDASGYGYSKGRFPDGDDSDINASDFSSLIASPGESNGNSIPLSGTIIDFESVPLNGFQTFQQIDVSSSAVGESPSGGNVYRCIDTTGGGVVAFFGDEALDATESSITIQGEIYIPASNEPVQSIAIGFCGSQGSTFFSGFEAGSSYEDGYWLIYQNAPGANLNNGRPDHPGFFEFVMASHDNMDSRPVDYLGGTSLAETGLDAGNWAEFKLSLDLSKPENKQITVYLNGLQIFEGPVPPGGRTSGSFMVGFRENHNGVPEPAEGTWIDNLRINQIEITDSWRITGTDLN